MNNNSIPITSRLPRSTISRNSNNTQTGKERKIPAPKMYISHVRILAMTSGGIPRGNSIRSRVNKRRGWKSHPSLPSPRKKRNNKTCHLVGGGACKLCSPGPQKIPSRFRDAFLTSGVFRARLPVAVKPSYRHDFLLWLRIFHFRCGVLNSALLKNEINALLRMKSLWSLKIISKRAMRNFHFNNYLSKRLLLKLESVWKVSDVKKLIFKKF